MRIRMLSAKVAVLVLAAAPVMGGVASADSKSVSDWVHETMDSQEERGGCEWGRAVSAAGADNRQGSGKNSPSPCK